MALHVLLVEDDRDLAETVMQFLELEEVICDHAASGDVGRNLACRHHYDVILLDIMLPRMNGLAVCEALRGEGIDTPVLMLTARDTLDDKLAGFRAGTDDYLVKPFALEELIVRVRSLARRRSGQARRLQIADLELWPEEKRACRAGKQLQLSPTAWILLELLVRESPRVVSRERLARAVWGDEPPDSNSLKVHIHNLRRAVDHGAAGDLIHTVPGHGFRIEAANGR